MLNFPVQRPNVAFAHRNEQTGQSDQHDDSEHQAGHPEEPDEIGHLELLQLHQAVGGQRVFVLKAAPSVEYFAPHEEDRNLLDEVVKAGLHHAIECKCFYAVREQKGLLLSACYFRQHTV